jgi:hypothetical protein
MSAERQWATGAVHQPTLSHVAGRATMQLYPEQSREQSSPWMDWSRQALSRSAGAHGLALVQPCLPVKFEMSAQEPNLHLRHASVT